MYTKRNYGFWQTVFWSRAGFFSGLFLASIIMIIHVVFEHNFDWMPWQPLSLLGVALAFYLGFKNNSSYERLWEARKIWGAIVNDSRAWAAAVISFIGKENPELTRQLIRQHLAWLTALRHQLRTFKVWEHADKLKDNKTFRDQYLPERKIKIESDLLHYLDPTYLDKLMKKGNKASQILLKQSQDVSDANNSELIDDFRNNYLHEVITRLYESQGKSERIKNYPFPRQYASAGVVMMRIFGVLAPMALLPIFLRSGTPHAEWLTIPFTGLLVWIFYLMDQVGDYSENPFEGLYNDTPITSMSRSIEIDLLEMLDALDIPDPIPAKNNFLM